ncbi:MAG: MFS transporter [Bacillota bacterium]
MFFRRAGRLLFGEVEPRLLFMCLLTAVHFAGATMPRLLIPLQLSDLGTSAEITGLVVSTYALFPLFIALPGGVIIDRLGSRFTILVGCALEVVAAYLLVRYPAVVPITAGTITAGVGNVLIIVAGQAYVAALGTPKSRANDFAVFGFATAFGHLIGPLLGGMISNSFGRGVAFAGLGVAGIAVALISLSLPPAGAAVSRRKLEDVETEGMRDLAKVARELLKDPRAQMSIIISGCALGAFSINTSFYPVFLERIGYSDGAIGALGSVRQLSALIVRPALGYLVGGFGARRTVQGVLLIGAVAIGVTPLASALVPLALLAALGGTTTALTQPISMIMMAEGADDEHRGLAMGLRLTGNRLVQFVGPIFLGVVVGYLGISWSFFGSALVLLVGAAVLYWKFSDYREVAPVGERAN